MQEAEPKRKMTPTDGAHIFFTLIFLAGSYMALHSSSNTVCSVNLQLVIEALFYGQLIWMIYLIITLIPRYKNERLRIIFYIIDLLYGCYHLTLLIYASTQFFNKKNNCGIAAPALNFLCELYIYVMIITFSIIFLISIYLLIMRITRTRRSQGFFKGDF